MFYDCKVALWTGIWLLSHQQSLAKVVHGQLWTGDNWHFLSRFCFLSMYGRFEYEVQYEADYGVLNLDLYYDSSSQWASVYGPKARHKTCHEKESVLQVENNQFINLTTQLLVAGCSHQVDNVTNVKYVKCQGMRNFNTARERWWFIAVSNCNSTRGLKLRYNFLMSNGPENDILHYHFSADEFYLLPILVTASVVHFSLLFVSIWCAVALKARQLLHSTYKLYLLAVFLHTIGLIMICAHYLSYGLDGIGVTWIKVLGKLLESYADILFILLLILIAKGYTVTRARLRTMSSIKLGLFVCSYAITYNVLFIIEQKYFDPGIVLYLYESIAGYGLIVLRVVGWCMLMYSTFFTLKHYPEKGGFYYPFFCFFTLWFVSGPSIVIIANHIIAQWVREKVVVSVEHFVVLMGHLVFLTLTRPGAQNKNFPYHVRTTQIGIMEAMSANTTLGQHALDHFGHGGSYNVTTHPTSMDIFTVETISSRNPAPAPKLANANNIMEASNGANGLPNGVPKIYNPNDEESASSTSES